VEGTGVTIAFWVLAGFTIGSAGMVILVRNLFHAILFLILSFVGFAGLYITLSADFVAVAQILVYAGAIAVLMIFAVMLSPRSDRDNSENSLQAGALILAGLMAAAVAFIALETDWALAEREPFAGTASAIGDALLDPFVLPFEIAAVLLAAAMIGAIILVREE
jgi:NADH-quinone oxidoreductase subunit J